MIASRNRIFRAVLSSLGVVVLATGLASSAQASGLFWRNGGLCWGWGNIGTTGTFGSSAIGTSSVLVPMAVTTTPMVQSTSGTTSGALVPMSLTPSAVTTNVVTAAAPVYYTYTTLNAPTTNTAQFLVPYAPLLAQPPSSRPQEGATILAEYNLHVIGENNAAVLAPTSIRPARSLEHDSGRSPPS